MLVDIITSKFFYIGFLCFSIFGLILADYKYKIVLFDAKSKKPALKSIGIVMGLLLLFDVLGIINKIFSTNQIYVVGLNFFSKDLPVEELLFLFLLCYFCLMLYVIIKNYFLKGMVDKNDV